MVDLVALARWRVQRVWAAIGTITFASSIVQVCQWRLSLWTRIKQVADALEWIAAFWRQLLSRLERKFGAPVAYAPVEFVMGASPWESGGYLASVVSGTLWQYCYKAFGGRDEKRTQAKISESSRQQTWETLACFVQSALWLPPDAGQ